MRLCIILGISNIHCNIFLYFFRISLKEFLQSFNRFNENQIYLTDLALSFEMNESNDVEICADLLSEAPIIDHDRGKIKLIDY